MKLLFITQVIDKNDGVLGFVHNIWLPALSYNFEKIIAVCLKKGIVELPKNVSTFPLGKEKGGSKLKYIINFYKYIFKERKDYDVVFIHMNPEYVILGWFLWKIWKKPIIIWYNHTNGNIIGKVSFAMADRVCHTSPYAFSAGRKKSRRMPAGIDTETFKPDWPTRKENSTLYLGRIAPVKAVHIAIQTMRIVKRENVILNIYGEALPRDREYAEKLKKDSIDLEKKGVISWQGEVPNKDAPSIFASHEICINLTPKGNYDKTVIEAMSTECIPLVSSIAFTDLLPKELFFKEGDSGDLAEKIDNIFSISPEERKKLGETLRQKAVERHSMPKLMEAIKNVFMEIS